jgi:adenylosuccinate synthase
VACTVVVGTQFGDEGKGRIIDYLAAQADFVVRFQGGDNAGHTVVNEYGIFRLHLVPSGIFYPRVVCIDGAGTVIDPSSLLQEIEMLEKAGVKTSNLWLDRRAQIVWRYHRLLDGAGEAKGGLGTTRRGIGPAYGDKAAYRGIRIGDLLHPEFLQTRLKAILPLKNHELAYYSMEPLRLEDLLQEAKRWQEKLGPRIVDSLPILHEAVASGKKVLLEGQLGAMRDLDWGIYPYSTASSPTAGGACAGAGIPPRSIESVVGVVKAYTTAVGGGPFPTELFDKDGERLREIGQEYGATTQRPRRCGWLDTVILRHSALLNDLTALAVTKLDVLDGLEKVKVCTAYLLDGKETTEMPDTVNLGRVQPIYEDWPGWKNATTGARKWDDLPQAARAYVKRIEELTKVPVKYVSVSPERENIIIL